MASTEVWLAVSCGRRLRRGDVISGTVAGSPKEMVGVVV
jgi:hypothetical protein